MENKRNDLISKFINDLIILADEENLNRMVYVQEALTMLNLVASLVSYDEYQPTKARNISALNPVDGFKCSLCGFEMEDYTRVEYDEDCMETANVEYEPKFCPDCGAKIYGE